jgi:hypothetical protein
MSWWLRLTAIAIAICAAGTAHATAATNPFDGINWVVFWTTWTTVFVVAITAYLGGPKTAGRLIIAAGIAVGVVVFDILWEVPDIIHRPIAFLTLYGIAVNIFKFCVNVAGGIVLARWLGGTWHCAQEWREMKSIEDIQKKSYELAANAMIKQKEWSTLVHGSIMWSSPPHRIDYAWLELGDGRKIDPFGGFCWDGWLLTEVDPKALHRYTRSEVRKLVKKFGHSGPWTDSERRAMPSLSEQEIPRRHWSGDGLLRDWRARHKLDDPPDVELTVFELESQTPPPSEQEIPREMYGPWRPRDWRANALPSRESSPRPREGHTEWWEGSAG